MNTAPLQWKDYWRTLVSGLAIQNSVKSDLIQGHRSKYLFIVDFFVKDSLVQYVSTLLINFSSFLKSKNKFWSVFDSFAQNFLSALKVYTT